MAVVEDVHALGDREGRGNVLLDDDDGLPRSGEPLADRQRAITTVPTEDPTLNKTIASRLRKGFIAREKVIRAEIVSVYALKK